jgi:hypothetical protein
MVDKDDDEDAQDTVERIKDAARVALESASSAIDDAKGEVQALIDEHESDEAEAIRDAVDELSSAIGGLEAADALKSAHRAVRQIGLSVKANEAEDEGEEENDGKGDEVGTA